MMNKAIRAHSVFYDVVLHHARPPYMSRVHDITHELDAD